MTRNYNRFTIWFLYFPLFEGLQDFYGVIYCYEHTAIEKTQKVNQKKKLSSSISVHVALQIKSRLQVLFKR